MEIAAVRNGAGLHAIELVEKWGGVETVYMLGKIFLAGDMLWYP